MCVSTCYIFVFYPYSSRINKRLSKNSFLSSINQLSNATYQVLHIRVYDRAPVYYSSAGTALRSTMTEEALDCAIVGGEEHKPFLGTTQASPPLLFDVERAKEGRESTQRYAANLSL